MIDKPEIKELVIEHVDHGYDTGVNANPTGIYIRCKAELQKIKVINLNKSCKQEERNN